VGAPSQAANTTVEGYAFMVGGPTLGLLPNLHLDVDGTPAATAVKGGRAGDAFGSHLVVDDFNQDGILDMVIGAAGAKSLYLFLGPLQ
jgi:hypothetical protein